MSHPIETIINDLTPFADLGAAPPSVVAVKDSVVARLVRNGEETELVFRKDGRLVESVDGTDTLHNSFRALLASRNFSDLRRWADSQALLLEPRVSRETINLTGTIAGTTLGGDVHFFDNYIQQVWEENPKPRSAIFLIDGPAGIGKTSLIRALAYSRARDFKMTQRPLILHVESRGRMLQNITDLMAYSLQSLRLAVTYDQIPILVRQGLIALAVDGFDELGDPSGYDLAWAQVNDLVLSARGGGTLIFAGRETFITKDRILRRLGAINTSFDKLDAFNIRALKPVDARNWLNVHGWSEENLDSELARPLFEEGSYALRPFFLSELARTGVEERLISGEIDDLLYFLINTMISREAGKFGQDVESVTTSAQRELFVKELMEEVARDLADNQTESVQSETLSWLAEAVSERLVPSELSVILRHRAGVIAFLTDDERRGYKKFVHDQVLNYFLSHVTINAVIDKELPKYIRRNIMGVDFLESFSDVFRRLGQDEIDNFTENVVNMIDSASASDRSRGNLAAILLSAGSVTSPTQAPVISNVSIDEAYISETASDIYLNNVVISQLTARSANFLAIKFDPECIVSSLIVDSGTVPSLSMPLPSVLSLPDQTIYNPNDVATWLNRQARSVGILPKLQVSEILSNLAPFSLLARIARYKPFWIKDGEEKAARKIIDDPYWMLLKELLIKHNLIIERQDVAAAGRPATFYHIKNRAAFVDLTNPPKVLWPFLEDLLAASIAIDSEMEK